MKLTFRNRRFAVIARNVCILFAVGASSAHAQFVLTNLGSFGGTIYGLTSNNLGTIGGYTYTPLTSTYQSFLYSGGTTTWVPEPAQTSYTLKDLNDSGQFTGTVQVGSGTSHALLYSQGVASDLGSLGVGGSMGQAINNAGQVVGIYYTNANGPGTGARPFLYSTGTSVDIGTLGGSWAGAYDINNAGVVVGSSDIIVGSQQTHAFVYSGGTMTDLGTFGGGASNANAINDLGQIVGGAETPLNQSTHAFLYSGGTMVDLGGFGGWLSTGMDINNAGQVVGTAELPDGTRHAFLYQNGTMVDLNTIVDLSGTNFSYLRYASSITDSGQIVGMGVTPSGSTQPFLLSPVILTAVPEPSAYVGVFAAVMAGWPIWRSCKRRSPNPGRS